MIDLSHSIQSTSLSAQAEPSDALRWDSGNSSNEVHVTHADFQAMVEGDDASESWSSEGSIVSGGGLMQLVRNVEGGKANVQSALLEASVNPHPAAIHAAAVALSRYDIQTLFLSKVANKTFQAVDRLTNLQ